VKLPMTSFPEVPRPPRSDDDSVTVGIQPDPVKPSFSDVAFTPLEPMPRGQVPFSGSLQLRFTLYFPMTYIPPIDSQNIVARLAKRPMIAPFA